MTSFFTHILCLGQQTRQERKKKRLRNQVVSGYGPQQSNYGRWHISLNFGKQKLNYCNYGVRPQQQNEATKAERQKLREQSLRCGYTLSHSLSLSLPVFCSRSLIMWLRQMSTNAVVNHQLAERNRHKTDRESDNWESDKWEWERRVSTSSLLHILTTV